MDVLDHRQWLQLRKQFQQLIKSRCRYPEHQEVADPECHGYGPEWAWSRYSVHVRQWNPKKEDI